jgi:hypothetical protein
MFILKERLSALVRDLFTFSSKVKKKFHNSIKEHLNLKKKSGADGIRSCDVWIKYPSPYRLRYAARLKLTDKKISIKRP